MFRKNLLYKQFGIVITSALLFASCQSGNKQANQTTASEDTANLKKEITQDVKSVVYPLPTPFQMTKMLNGMGASYISGILNPVSKADKYFTERIKAVNLGVYGADLAYAASYDQKQDVQLYSKALKTIIDELGINIDFSRLLSADIKQKVNNKDTLVDIITKTYYDTYKNLNEKSNPELAVMMVSGMWVELMYIATNISKETYHNSNIVKMVADQKDSYTKLMKILNEFNTKPDIKELESKLLKLKPAFDSAKNGLSEKDYLSILETIQSVRKSFVS
jgi:hypothetical protein